MLAEINAALTSLGLLTQMVKTALDARTEADTKKAVREFDATIRELHSTILAMQLQNQELLRVKMEAEEKLKAYEQWEVESAKYALIEPVDGIFVYALKPEHIGVEPAHWLCPNCYKNRKKSILQRETFHKGKRIDGRVCPHCDAAFSHC